MSDLVTVLYRIDRTGAAVPADGPAPPEYVPHPHAPITWARTELDYGPGYVRPRDSITTRADKQGEGAVYLAPGRYRITLPSRDTRDVTVSAEPAEIDLSALLAGGGVEPDDPQYPTLAAYVVDQIGVALEDQLDAIDEAVETAGESATTAQEARDAAVSAQAVTEAARDAAIEAQGLAEGARDAAEGHAQTAGTAAGEAAQARTDAQDAAGEASQSAADAADAAALAGTHRSAAESAAGDAAGSASAAQTAQGHAEDARDAAQGYAEDAQQAAQATAADRLAVSQDRQAIESEQAARLAAIGAAGDTQVGRVEDEGTAQVAAVTAAGTTIVQTVATHDASPTAHHLLAASAITSTRLVAWDDFGRSDRSLDGDTMPSGQVWTSGSDTAGRRVQIIGRAATSESTLIATRWAIYPEVDPSGLYHRALVGLRNGSTATAAIILAWVDPATYMAVGVFGSDALGLRIYTGGTSIELASASLGGFNTRHGLVGTLEAHLLPAVAARRYVRAALGEVHLLYDAGAHEGVSALITASTHCGIMINRSDTVEAYLSYRGPEN